MSIEACEPQVGSPINHCAANLHRAAYNPSEQPKLLPPQAVPGQLPHLTIVNDQPHATQIQPQDLDTQERRFCNSPIPSIPLPHGLPECEQEIKNRHPGESQLGAQVGVVKAVYGLGNNTIGLVNAGLSPAARLGNWLGNSLVNPQLAIYDGANWGNDTGKALVGATRAYQTMADYSLAVSRAEWQGDFLKEPRDAATTVLKAAANFAKQTPAQQAENITEQGISYMLPIASAKAITILPALAENAAANILRGPNPGGLKLCPAGAPVEAYLPSHTTHAGEDSILKMTGRGAVAEPVADHMAQSINTLTEKLTELNAKPLEEKLEGLEQINRDLITQRKSIKALGAGLRNADNMLQNQALDLINQVKTLKPQADEIGAKLKLTNAEEQLLDRYTAKENTAYQLVKDRLKQVYGWDEKASGMADRSIPVKDGFGTQRRVNNEMSNLLNDGLDRNPVVKEILKAKGISAERAKDWVGIPMPEGSAADLSGSDYLLVNKGTGEMYAIDVTQKVANLRSGRIADSILTDKNLAFKENQKCIPAERKNTVIAAADQDKIDNMVERLKNQGMSEPQAMKAAKLAEQNQLAEVIAKTISQPSQLNIFATRLPSANASVSPLVQAFELSQFQADLKKLGYDQWAARVGATIGYVQRTKAW